MHDALSVRTLRKVGNRDLAVVAREVLVGHQRVVDYEALSQGALNMRKDVSLVGLLIIVRLAHYHLLVKVDGSRATPLFVAYRG